MSGRVSLEPWGALALKHVLLAFFFVFSVLLFAFSHMDLAGFVLPALGAGVWLLWPCTVCLF